MGRQATPLTASLVLARLAIARAGKAKGDALALRR